MAKPVRSGLTGYERDERSAERKEKSEKYTEFSDMPVTGREATWRFDRMGEDNAQAQYDFFGQHSNADELISEMPTRDREVFRRFWSRGYFMDGQQYKGWDNMDAISRELTRTFDKYLDRTTLDKGVVVKRIATAELVLGAGNAGTKGVNNILSQLQSMVGRSVKSNGNMSTAAAKVGLPISFPESDTKAVQYSIKIPAGSKGAGMWIGNSRINDWGSAQREFMTNRDTWYRVDSVKWNGSTGRYEVELTFQGLDKHDYGRLGR